MEALKRNHREKPQQSGTLCIRFHTVAEWFLAIHDYKHMGKFEEIKLGIYWLRYIVVTRTYPDDSGVFRFCWHWAIMLGESRLMGLQCWNRRDGLYVFQFELLLGRDYVIR